LLQAAHRFTKGLLPSALHPLLHTHFDEQSNTIDMVTPPSCPGLNVEVIVDGQSLQEYDEIDEGPVAPNTVTKYIEARSNAYFAVRVRINDDFPFPASDLELKAKIDQQHVSRGLIAAKYLFDPRGNFAEGKKVHLSASNDVLHKFRFIALDLGECRRFNYHRATTIRKGNDH
jgi:hypothetical protein